MYMQPPRDLQLISDWADEWQTSFNASKTVHMLFRRKHRRHTPNPSPVLLLNSIEIPFAESTRHRGSNAHKHPVLV